MANGSGSSSRPTGGDCRARKRGDEEAQTDPGGELVYRLYVFDCHSGVLLDEQQLGPLPVPLDPQRAVFLDNRLVFAAASATIVVNGGGDTQ